MRTTAEYWLTENQLKVYPGDDWPDEMDAHFASRRWVWWPGQRVWVHTWVAYAEDDALAVAEEVLDVMDAVDITAKVERWGEYAENAERRAEASRKAVDAIADMIPLGQPILKRHHSEAHARRDADRIHNGMRRTVDETKKAGYWKARIHATETRFERKYAPDVVKRRLKDLESQLRAVQRHSTPAHRAYLDRIYDEPFTDETWQALVERNTREANNLEKLIAFWTAIYEESGGIPADQTDIKVGDYVSTPWGWFKVLKVNKQTVRIQSKYLGDGPLDKTKIKAVKTAEEYQAMKDAEKENTK